jgi:hypothetical protein
MDAVLPAGLQAICATAKRMTFKRSTDSDQLPNCMERISSVLHNVFLGATPDR